MFTSSSFSELQIPIPDVYVSRDVEIMHHIIRDLAIPTDS